MTPLVECRVQGKIYESRSSIYTYTKKAHSKGQECHKPHIRKSNKQHYDSPLPVPRSYIFCLILSSIRSLSLAYFSISHIHFNIRLSHYAVFITVCLFSCLLYYPLKFYLLFKFLSTSLCVLSTLSLLLFLLFTSCYSFFNCYSSFICISSCLLYLSSIIFMYLPYISLSLLTCLAFSWFCFLPQCLIQSRRVTIFCTGWRCVYSIPSTERQVSY